MITIFQWANIGVCENVTATTYEDVKFEILSRKAVQMKTPPGPPGASVNVTVAVIPFTVLDIDDAQQVLLDCYLYVLHFCVHKINPILFHTFDALTTLSKYYSFVRKKKCFNKVNSNL